MDQLIAETITRATREEAQRQARDDLDTLRRQATEAGRERCRAAFKISMIDEDSGTITYNPAGRLLRDWYLHTYINTLRTKLSLASEVIEIEDEQEAAALLQGLRPDLSGALAGLGVRSAEMIANSDAASAAARIAERLHHASAIRAVQHAPEDRFDGDELRVHLIRHWYQHCYDDCVNQVVQARHPLEVDIQYEDDQVALALETGEIHQMINFDGVSIVAAQLRRNEVARFDSETQLSPAQDLTARLDQRLGEAWSSMNGSTRANWLDTAGVPITSAASDWSMLDGRVQHRLAEQYLQTQRHDLDQLEHNPSPGRLDAEEAARRAFNHSELLAPRAITRQDYEPDLDRTLSLAPTSLENSTAERPPMRRS